jgi:capsular polysaccharide biosynthesis protein
MKPIAGPRTEFIEISQAEEGSANRAAFLTPGGGLARPPALSSSPDMTALLMALHRRWKLALASGIACGILAASAMWYAFPPSKYKAYVMLHVSTMPPKIVFDHDNSTSYSTYQRTQVALIKSRFVLSQAIKDPAIADLETIRTQSDPVDWLEKQIGVDFPGGSEILQINLSGERPGDLARIVNAVADSYLANIVENERRDRLKHYTELKSVYDRYQTILEEKRLALKKLAESVGSNDRQTLAVKQRLALGQLDRRRDELIQVQSDLKRLQVDLAALEAGERERYGEAPHGGVDESMIERDPRVAAFKERIAKDARRIAELKRTVRAASDPTITAVQREMQANQRALEDYRKALRSLQIEKGQKERRAVVAETRERVTTLKQYEEAIVKELELLMEKDDSFNKETLDLQTKEEQIALTSETARKVGTLMESIEVEVHAPPASGCWTGPRCPAQRTTRRRSRSPGRRAWGPWCASCSASRCSNSAAGGSVPSARLSTGWG